MWTDPVVNEIHQIRQKMLANAGGNIDVLMANFRAHQAAQGGVVIKGKLPQPVWHPEPSAAIQKRKASTGALFGAFSFREARRMAYCTKLRQVIV